MNKTMMIASHLKPQSGVALIEFSLVMVFLLIIMAGAIEFGRIFWYYDVLTKAARDGARFISASNALDIATAKEIVEDEVVAGHVPIDTNFKANQVFVICEPANCVNPSYMTVRIDYVINVGALFPVLDSSGGVASYSLSISPSTSMRYVP